MSYRCFGTYGIGNVRWRMKPLAYAPDASRRYRRVNPVRRVKTRPTRAVCKSVLDLPSGFLDADHESDRYGACG